MARKKSSSKKKGPSTGALEKKVDAVLLTRGLSLDEEPEKLLERSKRRQSKFKPGKQPRSKKKSSKSKKKTTSKKKSSKSKKSTKKTSSKKKKKSSGKK